MLMVSCLPDQTDVTDQVSTLIVARSARRQNSLRAMLKPLPWLNIIDATDDLSVAEKVVADGCAKLVVLDASVLGDQNASLCQWIEANSSQTLCLVLVSTTGQGRKFRAFGADEVFTTDQPIANLHATIKGLLAERDAGK
jgi:DNA-binding NarL/FixJ family response regulator